MGTGKRFDYQGIIAPGAYVSRRNGGTWSPKQPTQNASADVPALSSSCCRHRPFAAALARAVEPRTEKYDAENAFHAVLHHVPKLLFCWLQHVLGWGRKISCQGNRTSQTAGHEFPEVLACDVVLVKA